MIASFLVNHRAVEIEIFDARLSTFFRNSRAVIFGRELSFGDRAKIGRIYFVAFHPHTFLKGQPIGIVPRKRGRRRGRRRVTPTVFTARIPPGLGIFYGPSSGFFRPSPARNRPLQEDAWQSYKVWGLAVRMKAEKNSG